MARDPLAGGLCRQPGADPCWWDVDATPEQQWLAAWFCRTCPVWEACAEACVAAGPLASGTWAGGFVAYDDTFRDDAAAAFEALFGRMYTAGRIIDTAQLSLLDLMEAN